MCVCGNVYVCICGLCVGVRVYICVHVCRVCAYMYMSLMYMSLLYCSHCVCVCDCAFVSCLPLIARRTHLEHGLSVEMYLRKTVPQLLALVPHQRPLRKSMEGFRVSVRLLNSLIKVGASSLPRAHSHSRSPPLLLWNALPRMHSLMFTRILACCQFVESGSHTVDSDLFGTDGVRVLLATHERLCGELSADAALSVSTDKRKAVLLHLLTSLADEFMEPQSRMSSFGFLFDMMVPTVGVPHVRSACGFSCC
jgi:hypothetical protein